MMRGTVLTLSLSVAILAGACQKASDSVELKQMPKLPPPPEAKLAAELRIAVEVDGVSLAPIDAKRLATLKPDFQDGERRAWRMRTLLGEAVTRKGAAISVTGAPGVTLVLREPEAQGGAVPVLAETRRGEIVAAMIPPGEPFPGYHGQGRRLARPGDPLPRVPGVTKISVTIPK